jgi:ABC-2 type transport system ATP-binding protein
MIEARALTKFYGRQCALRGVEFRIEAREIVGFLGLNGSGKSTALHILAGLLAPSSGSVRIGGDDLLGPDGPEVRRRIGFLPDRPPVYEEMSVRAYLRFAARLRGASGQPRRLDETMEQTGLSAHADRPIEELSHGYRQRVGIAQAIVHEPDLVILDEPTSGLDPVQIGHMRALIRSLQERHTVLLSSHNLPEIAQTCDRLMIIREGQLVASATEEELRARTGATAQAELETTDDADAALEAAQAAGAVERFARRRPRVYSVELGVPIEELVARLVGEGVGLRRVQPTGSELEGLFRALTEERAA